MNFDFFRYKGKSSFFQDMYFEILVTPWQLKILLNEKSVKLKVHVEGEPISKRNEDFKYVTHNEN